MTTKKEKLISITRDDFNPAGTHSTRGTTGTGTAGGTLGRTSLKQVLMTLWKRLKAGKGDTCGTPG